MHEELKNAVSKLPVDDPIIKILRLHGEPTSELLEKTSFRQGEPPVGVAVDLWVPPHIDVLIDRVIELQNIFKIDDTHEVYSDNLELIDEKYREIIAEAMEMNDVDFKLFDRLHAVRIIETILGQIRELPSYYEALISNDKSQFFHEFSFSVQQQLHLCCFLQQFTNRTKGRGEVGRIMGENFFHDAFGPYCSLRDEPHHKYLLDEEWVDRICHVMEDMRKFTTQTLEANLAIAKAEYTLKPFSPNYEFYSLLSMLANRFELDFTERSDFLPIEKKSIIKFRVEKDTVCFGDSSALALVLYNIVKNPLKVAKFRRNKMPSVDVVIGNSIDSLCTSIFIRDTGLGFSFDELTKGFTEDAFIKLNEGKNLHFVEECLIDEAMCEHVPRKAIADLLCNRGASFGGGTGIGLSLAKEIIEIGHQGAIRLYNHPSMGAGVQILLPNADKSDTIEEKKQITRWTLREQMKQGLSPALNTLM